MKQRYLIDSHKLLTTPVVLVLMAVFQQWDNPTAWIYLALHATYGIIWVIKSYTFPDKRWEETVPPINALFIFLTLALYWVAPYLLMSRGVQAPGWVLAVCISMYTFGIFLHYTADMQKHMALKLNPGHLINDGLWARIRNPNYLGELLIYVGYGLLALHWLPLVIIVAIMLIVWLPNMNQKDRSLARYPEFPDYKQRSKRLIPFVW